MGENQYYIGDSSNSFDVFKKRLIPTKLTVGVYCALFHECLNIAKIYIRLYDPHYNEKYFHMTSDKDIKDIVNLYSALVDGKGNSILWRNKRLNDRLDLPLNYKILYGSGKTVPISEIFPNLWVSIGNGNDVSLGNLPLQNLFAIFLGTGIENIFLKRIKNIPINNECLLQYDTNKPPSSSSSSSFNSIKYRLTHDKTD
ncbi:MAG: hypothetical protein CVU81_02710 [Euryarchaeota archaeon HGW-Euryarchaeota-1]|nr:MAG: hypothetical protein CVU81_02710 [Euryarchaeota archaeon HGW-Euryarchaeota-1]